MVEVGVGEHGARTRPIEFGFSGQVTERWGHADPASLATGVYTVRVADWGRDAYYAIIQAPEGLSLRPGAWVYVVGLGSFTPFAQCPIVVGAGARVTVIDAPEGDCEDYLPPAMLTTRCRVMEDPCWFPGEWVEFTEGGGEGWWHGRGYRVRVALPGGAGDGCMGVITHGPWSQQSGEQDRDADRPPFTRGELIEINAFLDYKPDAAGYSTPIRPVRTPLLQLRDEHRLVEEQRAS